MSKLFQAILLSMTASLCAVPAAMADDGTVVSGKSGSQDFSVWLIPSITSGYKDFAACIGEFLLNPEDSFEPHITIYFGKSSDLSLDNVKAVVMKTASQNAPVTLTVNGIGITRERFKSLFLTFSKNAVLEGLAEAIRKSPGVLDTGYVLQPHLSLFYSPEGIETPAAYKTAMLDRVLKKHPEWFSMNSGKGEFDKGYEVLFDRIQIRIEHNGNKVNSWKKLHEFRLANKR